VGKRSTFAAEAAKGFLLGAVQKTEVLVLEELGLLLGRRVKTGSIRVERVGVGGQLLERGPRVSTATGGVNGEVGGRSYDGR